MIDIKNEQGYVGTNIELKSIFSQEGVEVAVSKIKYTNASAQALIKVKINSSFSQPIVMNLSGDFNGRNVNFDFALPVLISKYVDSVELDYAEFKKHWKDITYSDSSTSQRFDTILYNPLEGSKTVPEFLKKIGSLLAGMGFKVYSPNDINNFYDLEAYGALY